MEDVWVGEVSHFHFQLETAWVAIEGPQAHACHFEPAVGLEQKVEALWVNGVRCNDLAVGWVEVRLQKVLKVL